MSYKLLIVESPTKARKIASFLGAGWRVEASLGHVRDLPERDLGVDVEHAFALTYYPLPGKQAVIKRLIQAMHEADHIYLATDPDREGEAMAWHILQVANLPKGKPIERVTFTSITKAAVLAAIVTPRPLDVNLVEAQQTRRAVDRLTGYLASSLTSRALDERASAGRVQSVCLRLVVEREEAIAAFTPRTYWSLAVRLRAPSGEFVAQLGSVKGNRVEQLSREQADILVQRLTGAVYSVGAVEHTETMRRSAPPFTTASLQQAAGKALRLTPDETMRLAQALYERGDVTYMRTDGVEVAPEAQRAARQFITQFYGEAYLPPQPPVYHAKSSAQESHEAIRPTDVTRETVADGQQKADALMRLYELIRARFLASQMAPARFTRTVVSVQVGETTTQPYPIVFEVCHLKPVFDGFLKVYEEALEEGEAASADSGDALPDLTKGQPLAFVEWLKVEHTTRAPERYTEASLVQALETRGIGRPATYAPTIKLVKDKGYVKRDGNRLVPTEVGIRVCAFVVEHFPHVFEFDYTARLEAELDQVAAGTVTRLAVLTAFWEDFQPSLRAVGEVVNRALAARPKPQPVGADCPKCGKPLVKRQSRYGEFVACSGFPNCKFTATADFAERAGIAVAAISADQGVTP
ncbi:MAG: type I DNA topoisomerase [Aggregatilineales bacterium]